MLFFKDDVPKALVNLISKVIIDAVYKLNE